MSTKFAAIDIGSNSSLLLILELSPENIARVVIDTKISTRLSAGAHSGEAIHDSALQRQFAALDKFAEVLARDEVGSVIACGTQVFRVAANGPKVAEEISRRYGWRMDIISGEREAQLSYRAATTGLKDITDSRNVIDVGGGSSEVILGAGDKIAASHSFPVGAVSITEKFDLEAGDRNLARIDAATFYLYELFLDDNFAIQRSRSEAAKSSLIAVGGTAATLAALKLDQKIFVPGAIHGVQLSKKWIQEQIVELFNMDAEDRRKLMPYDPDRADIIVGGALIIEGLLSALERPGLIVSNCGLRWGLIIDTFPALAGARIEQ
ncbi:MAG: hypothetical protein WBP29_05150 [Candidatus Zixiibacteriota bacterium]